MLNRRRVLSAAVWAVVVLGVCVAGRAADRRPDVHFVPTPTEVVEAMLKAANVGKDDVVYDLGCGDGRLVITAVKQYGARKGVGIDIDPARIKDCLENVTKAGAADRVSFLQQDLYETDFSEATVVTLYLLPALNVRLRPALFRQLRPGDRIVSHAFDMAEWKADQTLSVPGDDWERTAYYWRLPASVAGTWRWTMPGAKGEQTFELRLKQRFQNASGGAKVDGKEQPAGDVMLVGDRLSFSIGGGGQGEKAKMIFSGRVIGDTIRGTVATQGGADAGKRDWAAKRDAVNLAGTWRWAQGDKQTSIDIRRYDGRFYASMPAGKGQAPVPQFYVWGAGVYFIIEGSPRQTFDGIADGDRIVGKTTGDGADAQDWTAQRATD
jgi:SAM-dependent methyltransferase